MLPRSPPLSCAPPPPCCFPTPSWIVHFQERYKQYQKMISEGDPKVVWLSGLHIPESYITALVQTTCRRRGWALDKSALFTQVCAPARCAGHTLRPRAPCCANPLAGRPQDRCALWPAPHS